MAGEAAQRNESEKYVIALLREGGVRRFNKREDAPADVAMVFSGIEDLEKLTVEQLDRLTKGILKAQIPDAKTKRDAVDRAWTAVVAAANAEERAAASAVGRSAKPPKIGKSKFTLTYDFDNPGARQEQFNALPPQAQNILKIMALGSSKTLPETEVRKLINERSAELNTRQEPWRIVQYYRNRLRDEKFIQIEG